MQQLIILSLAFSLLYFLYSFLNHFGIYVLAIFKGKNDRNSLIPLGDKNPVFYIMAVVVFALCFYFASSKLFIKFLDFYFAPISILIVLNSFSICFYYYNYRLKKSKFNNFYNITYSIFALLNCFFCAIILSSILQSKTLSFSYGFFKQLFYYFNGISLSFAVFFTSLSAYLANVNLFLKTKNKQTLNFKNVKQSLLVNVGFVLASCFFFVLICSLNLSFIVPKITSNSQSITCFFLLTISMAIFAVTIHSEKYNFAKFLNFFMALMLFLIFAFTKFPKIIISKKITINVIEYLQQSEHYFALGLAIIILIGVILPLVFYTVFTNLKNNSF